MTEVWSLAALWFALALAAVLLSILPRHLLPAADEGSESSPVPTIAAGANVQA